MINPSSISRVIETCHVEDVIDEFVTLKKRGANLLGLCPFHNEKTPSFTVSPAKNLYKCFGCGKGGNAVSFIMEHENYSFPEAIRFLAKKYGIEIEETEQTEEEKEKIQENESLFIINEFAKEFFHSSLLETDEGKSVGLSYFNNRGILNKTINDFQLGYSPIHKKTLVNLAEVKGYKAEYVEKLGLKSKSGLDFFRSRIIFPITNLSGKVIAFGGRTLSSDKKIPKYLNSPESDIYYKSKSLYGIYQAKNDIRRNNNCFLVEGYTDVLSLHQNEIKNAVASSGTALTLDQLRVIKRFCTNITFLYDGDSAGQKAALRGLPLALSEDLDVKIVPLEKDQDPDSLVQELGISAFHKYLEENTKDFIVHHTKRINQDFANLPIEKSQAIRELIEILASILDPIKRSIYVKEITSILSIPEESFVGELNKKIRKKINSKKREQFQKRPTPEQEESFINSKLESTKKVNPKPQIHSDYHQEKDLIRVLIIGGDQISAEHNTTIAQFIVDNIGEVLESFQDETFKSIIIEAKDNLLNGGEPFKLDHYINHDNENVKEIALEFAHSPFDYAKWSDRGVELQTQKMPSENFDKDSEQSLYRFMLKKIQDKILIVESKLKQENLSSDQLRVLLAAKSKLDDSRRQIAISQGNIVL